MPANPLDELIQGLNGGDHEAAERAFLAYEPYLRMAVRRRLSGPLRAKLDSTDIIQSVWADLLCGFRAARWRFTDRAHLQAFLTRVAFNRLIDHHRQFRRVMGREQSLEEVAPRDLPPSSQSRPSEVAQGEELWERMLTCCTPVHREVLRLKRQGIPLAEIARRCGLHEGSVRRILYDLARRLAATRTAAPLPR